LPYPLTGERRNTLLLLGETGVFVISASGSTMSSSSTPRGRVVFKLAFGGLEDRPDEMLHSFAGGASPRPAQRVLVRRFGLGEFDGAGSGRP
jgi:hypothetical protein